MYLLRYIHRSLVLCIIFLLGVLFVCTNAMYNIESGIFVKVQSIRHPDADCGYNVIIGHKEHGVRLYINSITVPDSLRAGNDQLARLTFPSNLSTLFTATASTVYPANGNNNDLIPLPVPFRTNLPVNYNGTPDADGVVHAIFFFARHSSRTCSLSQDPDGTPDFSVTIKVCAEYVYNGTVPIKLGMCSSIDSHTQIKIELPSFTDMNSGTTDARSFIIPAIDDSTQDKYIPVMVTSVVSPRAYLHRDSVKIRIPISPWLGATSYKSMSFTGYQYVNSQSKWEEGTVVETASEATDIKDGYEKYITLSPSYTTGDPSEIQSSSFQYRHILKLNLESSDSFEIQYPQHQRVHPCLALIHYKNRPSPCVSYTSPSQQYPSTYPTASAVSELISDKSRASCKDGQYNPAYYCALPSSFSPDNQDGEYHIRHKCLFYPVNSIQQSPCSARVRYTLTYYTPIQCSPLHTSAGYTTLPYTFNDHTELQLPNDINTFESSSSSLTLIESIFEHNTVYNSILICKQINVLCEDGTAVNPTDTLNGIHECLSSDPSQVSSSLEFDLNRIIFSSDENIEVHDQPDPISSEYSAFYHGIRITAIRAQHVLYLPNNIVNLVQGQTSKSTINITPVYYSQFITHLASQPIMFSDYTIYQDNPATNNIVEGPSTLPIRVSRQSQTLNVLSPCQYYTQSCPDVAVIPSIETCKENIQALPSPLPSTSQTVCVCKIPGDGQLNQFYYSDNEHDNGKGLSMCHSTIDPDTGTSLFSINFVHSYDQGITRVPIAGLKQYDDVSNMIGENTFRIILNQSPQVLFQTLNFPDDRDRNRQYTVRSSAALVTNSPHSDISLAAMPTRSHYFSSPSTSSILFDPNDLYRYALEMSGLDHFSGTFSLDITYELNWIEYINPVSPFIPVPRSTSYVKDTIFIRFTEDPSVKEEDTDTDTDGGSSPEIPKTCDKTLECDKIRGGAYCNADLGGTGQCQCRDTSLTLSKLGCVPSCPCLNSGRCIYHTSTGTVADTLSYTCQCPTGLTGPLCQTRHTKYPISSPQQPQTCNLSSFLPDVCVMGTLECSQSSTQPQCTCSTSWGNLSDDPLPKEQCATCNLTKTCSVEGTHKVSYTRERCGSGKCVCSKGYTGQYCQNKAVYGDMTFTPTALSVTSHDIDDYRTRIMMYLRSVLFPSIPVLRDLKLDELVQYYGIYNTYITYKTDTSSINGNTIEYIDKYHITLIFDPIALSELASSLPYDISSHSTQQIRSSLAITPDDILSSLYGQWDSIGSGLTGTDTETLLGVPSQEPIYNPSVCDMEPPLDPLPKECETAPPTYKDTAYDDEYTKSSQLDLLDPPEKRNTASNVGMVVGIVVGCCVAFIILLISIIWAKKNKKWCFAPKQKRKNQSQSHDDNSRKVVVSVSPVTSREHGSELAVLAQTRTDTIKSNQNISSTGGPSSTMPTPVPGNDGEKLPHGWNKVRDPATGKKYYLNDLTLETSWDAPNPDGTKTTSGNDLGW